MYLFNTLKINNRSQSKPVERRQNFVISSARLGFVLALSSLAAGCSISSTLSSSPTQEEIITSSVTDPVAAEGIATQDAEIIKTTVANTEGSNLRAWQNPDTGNKGTITAIDNFVGKHGQQCKKFQTTVDSFMGISLYNGETCELKKGFWVLSWFIKQDS
ncbi:MAG: RT0821/Lpp0805 family surface protein [Pseudomonadota bacterium]